MYTADHILNSHNTTHSICTLGRKTDLNVDLFLLCANYHGHASFSGELISLHKTVFKSVHK